MAAVRFLVDGERVNQTQTPEQLELEDGDQIEVMIEQVGAKVSQYSTNRQVGGTC